MKKTTREATLAFELDDPDAGMNFSQRLARENQWTEDYTARVIKEYKRFLVLCAEAGHSVTPSDAVDQVWHLHLCYTESYWNRFCRDTLGFPLHHGPTKGGSAERSKFSNWYERTLSSYKRIFGEVPPEDIWQPSRVRFGSQDFRRVDYSSNFVISKRAVLFGLAGVGITLSLASCASVFTESNDVPWFWIMGGIVILFVIVKASRYGGGSGGGGCGWFGGGCSSDSGCGCGGGGGGCGS